LKACFGLLPLLRMNYSQLGTAFARLGKSFVDPNNAKLAMAKRKAAHENLWFDEKSINLALQTWHDSVTEESIQAWIKSENLVAPASEGKKIGLVMAGNIPLVGLHDLLSVLISGHQALVKLSSDDTALMMYAIEELAHYDSWLAERLQVVERLNEVDALIATGSNNTSRYFEYYFRNVPHIIRKNRNSIAILTGEESQEELFELGHDVFSYYGLGCRNVTQILFPKHLTPSYFYDAIPDHYEVLNHNKYANNYTYHRALFLLNQHEHLDNNFLLLTDDWKVYSPVGCINYAFYETQEELNQHIATNVDSIQTVVSKGEFTFPTTAIGQAQKPTLSDYADGVNTVEFCRSVK